MNRVEKLAADKATYDRPENRRTVYTPTNPERRHFRDYDEARVARHGDYTATDICRVCGHDWDRMVHGC